MLCKHGLWRVPSLHPWVLRMSDCLASALPADVFFCLQLSVAILQSAGMSVRAFFCLSCSTMCKDSPWVATTHFLCLDLTANRTVTCYAPSSRLVFLASPYSFTDTKLGSLCGPDEPLPIKSPQISGVTAIMLQRYVLSLNPRQGQEGLLQNLHPHEGIVFGIKTLPG